MANTSILAAFERMWLHVLAALGGKADTNHTHNYAASESEGGAANSAYVKEPVVTAGTGAAYTATVPGITALTKGVSFVMVPHAVSTTTQPTLNVNGLGAKGIRRRLSNISTTVQNGYSNNWLGKEQPFTVTYNGTYWIVEGNIKTAAVDLYGQVGIANGGTGATDAATALSNLGGVPANAHTDAWVGFGTDQFVAQIGGGDITFTGGDGEGAYIYSENGSGTLYFGGTVGDESVRLENIATPVSNRDAANKEYVDSKFRTARGSWDMSGGTITCGFKPDVVFITEVYPASYSSGDFSDGTVVWATSHPWMDTWEEEDYEALSVTDTGFVVSDPYGANGSFTGVDHTYYYLAVKFG